MLLHTVYNGLSVSDIILSKSAQENYILSHRNRLKLYTYARKLHFIKKFLTNLSAFDLT